MRIRHAIVGCGRVAPNHFDAFARIPGVEIAYAVDFRRQAAETWVERGLASAAAEDLDTVLADPDLTSLSLCVPHDLHAPMAMRAVACGKHVLIEKPFVIDPEDGRRLLAAAAASALVVMPVAQHRYEDVVAIAQAIVASGALGRIAMVRGHLECVRPPEYYADSDWRGSWVREGGSVLINQAYHIVELIRWIAGPVQQASARMATIAHPEAMETEDVLAASLQFANGAVGALSICGAAGSQWRSYIEVLGTDGELAFDINFPNVVHRFQLRDKRAMQQWRKKLKAASEAVAEPPPGVGYYGAGHRGQAEAFIASIRGETDRRGADLAHALDVVALIGKLYVSARRDAAQ